MSVPSVMINANFSLHAKTNAVAQIRQDAQSAVAKSRQCCSPTTLVAGPPKNSASEENASGIPDRVRFNPAKWPVHPALAVSHSGIFHKLRAPVVLKSQKSRVESDRVLSEQSMPLLF